MRPLPPDVLARIYQKLQTPGNNADPRLEVIISRGSKYITAGTPLLARTMRTGPGLGAFDVALRRESHLLPPDMVFMAYIEGGQAHVAQQPYVATMEKSTAWEYLYTLGPAVDVAAELDGRWVRASKEAKICFDSPANWTHITFGEPWFFRVTPDGALIAHPGQGSPLTLAADNVSKVAAQRSWKNVMTGINHDHGLVVAYIRDGAVKYRTYAEQDPTFEMLWEVERTIPFDTSTFPAVNVALFRTNDYRLGCLAEINGLLEWWITRRNWAGMAIPAEKIAASITDLQITLLPVYFYSVGGPTEALNPAHEKGIYRWGEHDCEKIAASITALSTTLLWASDTLPVSAENIAMTDTVTGEEVGTGNGAEDEFALLHAPGNETETIYLDGTPLQRGTDYTLASKVITFTPAPGAGVAITADYEWQNWGKQIKITYDHGLSNIVDSNVQFLALDESLNEYLGQAAAGGESEPPQLGLFSGTRQLLLTVVDFNNAYPPGQPPGDITVHYTAGVGFLQGEVGQDVPAAQIAFVPAHLDPLNIPAPEMEAIWNE
jgi:hypothetical protein